MSLRKGKTKNILESSMDSSLLAVEIYNKPRAVFRTEAFISLMIIAWTRLFHAHFNNTSGNVYYYKKKGSNRYEYVDGERKAWELSKCIKEYNGLTSPEVKNLEFFIKLRNKIEHRDIDRKEIDALIFGECQALLYNYENLLVKLFGAEYSINESLAFSLQFSLMRTDGQKRANKNILSKELLDLKNFVEIYRSGLNDNDFNAQEYSVKLIHVPKISNTNKSDLAIEFVNWSNLDEEDKAVYDKLLAIIKDKVVKVEAANVGKLKPSGVIEKVRAESGVVITQHEHKCLYSIFSIRPPGGSENPEDTNTDFCHYNEVHQDYLYQEAWVDFIKHVLERDDFSLEIAKESFKKKSFLNIEDYR